jgi:hypothetical protein
MAHTVTAVQQPQTRALYDLYNTLGGGYTRGPRHTNAQDHGAPLKQRVRRAQPILAADGWLDCCVCESSVQQGEKGKV